MILALLLACGTDGPETGLEDQDPLVSLEAPRLLRRISLDLRGIVPTEAELDAVEATLDIPAIVDEAVGVP